MPYTQIVNGQLVGEHGERYYLHTHEYKVFKVSGPTDAHLMAVATDEESLRASLRQVYSKMADDLRIEEQDATSFIFVPRAEHMPLSAESAGWPRVEFVEGKGYQLPAEAR